MKTVMLKFPGAAHAVALLIRREHPECPGLDLPDFDAWLDAAIFGGGPLPSSDLSQAAAFLSIVLSWIRPHDPHPTTHARLGFADRELLVRALETDAERFARMCGICSGDPRVRATSPTAAVDVARRLLDGVH